MSRREREREREKKKERTQESFLTSFVCLDCETDLFLTTMARRLLLIVAILALFVSSSIFLAAGAAAEPGEVVSAAEPKIEVESKKADAPSSPAPAPASKTERDVAKVDASLTKAYDKAKDGVEDAYKKVRERKGGNRPCHRFPPAISCSIALSFVFLNPDLSLSLSHFSHTRRPLHPPPPSLSQTTRDDNNNGTKKKQRQRRDSTAPSTGSRTTGRSPRLGSWPRGPPRPC